MNYDLFLHRYFFSFALFVEPLGLPLPRFAVELPVAAGFALIKDGGGMETFDFLDAGGNGIGSALVRNHPFAIGKYSGLE